ncbi:MAG: glycine--tRNA ligase subunit beta [Candidatus Saganbacteria bacterium]|nr:glycine--tRNA ligase subunit beta [Candidatus Saganbacteria bacterium]
MSNALLEIGCEEIPARFMPGFLADLKQKTEEKLKTERISFSSVAVLGTFRRLTVIIENIAARQEDLSQEVKGPPADRAYDQAGKPTKAAEGFAKSQGVELAALVKKPVGVNDYVFAQVIRKGEATDKVLARIFPEVISSLYQPLAMRWGDLEFRFIRPIHWIVALCGSKVVKFELAGIKSGTKTLGHRYAKNPRSEIRNPDKDDYIKTMAKIGVIVDQHERKELVKQKVEAAAKKAGAEALIPADLLDEVTYLVEDPIAYVGEFNKAFLDIPQEVLITSMKKNQKYFPLVKKGRKEPRRLPDRQAGSAAGSGLLPLFVVVTNGCRSASITDGNQKVLSARLSDAKFFFDEDKKLPLEMRRSDLEKVGYFEKLGTVAHKVERVAKLAEWFGKKLGLDEAGLKRVRRIAELCKADLTTKMVYEFPELQGVMGREYALLAGEDKIVAQGIFEHYLPRFAEDDLPQSLEGTAVALADRFDSLVGCFSISANPTGSVDPYGLRRAANGIIRIIIDKKLDILLDEAIEHSYKLYEKVFLAYLFEKGETGYQDFSRIKQQLIEFIAARLKPMFQEEGVRYDISDAVLADCNDILDCSIKVKVINELADKDWFTGVVKSAERVSRIAKDAPRDTAIETDLEEDAEKDLFSLAMKINWEVGEAINKEDWGAALRYLIKLTDPIETFFDKVLVMCEDERLKTNRLALCKYLEKLYLRVADLRKVVLPG